MQDEMTIDEGRKYVKLMAKRYQQAKRKERTVLFSEMEQVRKVHRKHLLRLLHGASLQRKKRSTARRLDCSLVGKEGEGRNKR